MIRLEPMSDEEFGAYLERSIPRRAARYVARGVWTPGESIRASREAYERLLPDGRTTPGNFFCHIVNEADRARVGEVWYTSRDQGGRIQFWIEWIWIEPDHRRRGYASAAIQTLETIARQLGATRTGLDVWSDNPAAIALYEKLGYATVRRAMVKPLDRGG